MTVGDVVREEVGKCGLAISDADVEHVLWEFTGWPCFWLDATKTPEENLRAQLHEYFTDPEAAHERRDRDERAMLEAFRVEP